MVFKQNHSLHPGIKVVAEQFLYYSREKAMKFTEDVLIRFPEPGSIAAIVGGDDEMMLGSIQAIEVAGRANEGIITTGWTASNEGMQAVFDGRATVVSWRGTSEPETTIAILKLMSGKKVPKEIWMPTPVITQEIAKHTLGTNF